MDPEKLRSDLEKQLAEWSNLDRGTSEQQQVAQEAWHKYELLTTGLSQELCEQLRLVLEPSLATKLKYVKFEKTRGALYALTEDEDSENQLSCSDHLPNALFCLTLGWGGGGGGSLTRGLTVIFPLTFES